NAPGLARLASLQERILVHERRLREIRAELAGLKAQRIDEEGVTQALAEFDPIWDTMTHRERTNLIQLLVEQVRYDGGQEKTFITIRKTGIQALAMELSKHQGNK